jgi:DNA polymerase-3 subunit gamma/tau
MSYTALARRYRSRAFGEVVGQDAIARTLENAIGQNRVAHAYLFVGTRGVGKTTMARVFAKALNGGGEAVDEAIMSGQDTDVVEIDAASNRGIDNARELIESSAYRPLRGKYKIYIIDEVHMLTKEAFNALLKTLEEPPEHVKFILCTTETHKVPATIQSRCQRFDFRLINAAQIAGHLGYVCGEEGVTAAPDLLESIGWLGNGSMRDALSLLDRVIAAGEGGEELSVELLERLLGLPERKAMAGIIDAIADGDSKAVLELVDGLLTRGIAMDQFMEAMATRLRDLMVLSACGGETELVALSGAARREALEQAQRFDEAALSHMIAVVESVQRMCRVSAVPRALLDAMVVRLAMTERMADVAKLIEGGGGRVKKA